MAKRKLPTKNAEAVENGPGAPKRRWVRNGELAKYLGVSKMYVWRLKHDPKLKHFDFPSASVINTIEFNDLDKIDAWMEAHVAAAS
jgi:hypothetical protein